MHLRLTSRRKALDGRFKAAMRSGSFEGEREILVRIVPAHFAQLLSRNLGPACYLPTAMPTTLKHRQHHVCQTYLRGWATDDKIWVLQGELIHRAQLKDVAVQRHFYKLQPLTKEDREFLAAWISKSPEKSRKTHENFVTMFGLPATLRACMTDAEVSANPELVALLDEQIINAEEDFHADIESRVAPQIEALRRGDVSFFSDKEIGAQFSHFLALQHFRTNAVRSRAIKRFLERAGMDISRSWNTLAHILASNVGLTFYQERRLNPLVLLRNETSVPFITSDQPTVNLLGGTDDDKGPEHLALYYPVTPNLAVLLDAMDQPCGLVGKTLSKGDVETLNAQVVRTAHRQIFASCEEILAAIASAKAKAA